jgi:hypothetical protein
MPLAIKTAISSPDDRQKHDSDKGGGEQDEQSSYGGVTDVSAQIATEATEKIKLHRRGYDHKRHKPQKA